MGGVSVTETRIRGLLAIDLVVNRDHRGWFKESYVSGSLSTHGVADFDVVQHNVTYNEHPGVLRGIHAEPWDKYVSVAAGCAFAAIVDLREGDSFGEVQTFDLTPDQALYVPRGCGNSYQTVEPHVVYTYLVNGRWSASTTYTSVNPFDRQLAIDWPVARGRAVLSERDAALPSLAEIVPVATR